MNWPLLVGALMAVTLSSLGRLGGVRIDADAGFCESGDQWAVTSHSAIVVRPDGSSTLRVAAGNLSSLPETCRRELGGLLPGPYRVLVTPPRSVLPPFSFSFEVRARQWTQVELRQPPVVVRGRITANGVPVPGITPNFVPVQQTSVQIPARRPQPMSFAESWTDDDGRYATVLWAPGTYTQSFRLHGQELPVASREIALGVGNNVNDVDVGVGALRIWFTERGATLQNELTVRLTLHTLPQRPFERTVRASSGPVEVGMLAPGPYVVRATAEKRTDDGRVISLVSAREPEITLAAHQSIDATIDLVSREGWLEVVHADGRPIEGASVVMYPGAASLRTDEGGRVSLATLPVGARVPIRTRTWGMTCHVVTDDLLQRVTISDASESVIVRLPYGPATVRPIGPDTARLREQLAGSNVTGLAGASCPLPFEAFSVAEARVPGAVELTLMLPDGWYTLTLRDGRTFPFRAPGLVVIK
jgi:hypothetical protein